MWDGGQEAITMEGVKQVFNSFSKLMAECATREQQKKLLHMLLSKITINEDRKIEAMEITVNKLLLQYIEKAGKPIVGNPAFSFVYR